MNINKAFIIDFLTYKASRPLKVRELAKEMDVPSNDYNAFRSLVKEMIDEGILVNLRRGKIGIPSEMNLVVGLMSVSRQGEGIVLSESEEHIGIDPSGMHTSLDGDKVMVRIGQRPDGDKFGTVIRILERAEKHIIGIFQKGRNFSFVIPEDKRIRRDIYIPVRQTKKAQDGDRVVAVITEWDEPFQNPEGKVIEVLGDPESSGVDIRTVILKYALPGEFPNKVKKESEGISTGMISSEIKRRTDFCEEISYTIDPSDAKDHDDAISIRKIKNGYRLGVYIADVSFFVRPNTALDKEALLRGNSVYLPGTVIPMLPERLSNELCSLKPNRKRLVSAAIIDFDKNGKMLKWELADGVIRSRARLSYEEVQHFFDTGERTAKLEKVAESLTLARELAGILQNRRMEAGSLDFDLPEARIVMNKKGEVIEIGNRVRLESHRLVEEFMLAANKAVALHFSRLGVKALYRVHDKPDLEKLNAFSYMMSTLGFSFPVSDHMKPIQFSKLLEKIKGRPEEGFVNELMLRSMQKAVYQPKNIGHFGLAFKHYVHFTSPIRRYPDLMIHRLIRKLDNGRYPVSYDKKLHNVLKNIGDHCSETERTAEAAEREAVKYKQTIYMKEKIGEDYNGVISGVLSFGFFVRLDKIGAEGMVRLSTMDDDYYAHDEKHHRLIGRRTGRIFRIGDPISVKVINVNVAKNEIDLAVIGKSDPEKYVRGGRGKSKRGKRGTTMYNAKKPNKRRKR